MGGHQVEGGGGVVDGEKRSLLYLGDRDKAKRWRRWAAGLTNRGDGGCCSTAVVPEATERMRAKRWTTRIGIVGGSWNRRGTDVEGVGGAAVVRCFHPCQLSAVSVCWCKEEDWQTKQEEKNKTETARDKSIGWSASSSMLVTPIIVWFGTGKGWGGEYIYVSPD